jgi:hypothetical protein
MLTAAAILNRIAWQDTFSRTDWASWGPDYGIEAAYGTFVDGEAGRLVSGGYVNATLSNSLKVAYGFVQFDFWVPADGTDYRPYFYASQGTEFPIGVEILAGYDWMAYIYYQLTVSETGSVIYSFTPDPGSWYRFKTFFNGARGEQLGLKVWKVGDPEPDDLQAVAYIDDDAVAADPDGFTLALTVYAPATEDAGFDNFIYGDYGAAFSPKRWGGLTADAILMLVPEFSFDAGAWIEGHNFSASAWIVGGRSGHSRFWDHYGTEPDTVVVLDGAIEKYPSGAVLHTVLADIVSRITALESGNHVALTFAMGAWIQPCLRANAILFKTMTKNPWWGNDLQLKVDALIVGGKTDQPITASAWIVRPVETSLSAAAYLIDLVC